MNNTVINCLVVDDEPLAARLIARYIGRTPGLRLVHSTTDSAEALRMIHEGQVAMVFLDIQMPGIGGFELMQMLRRPIGVIIVSAYAQYALQSYEYEVLDYLLKPVSYDRFRQATERAITRLSGAPAPMDAIFLKTGQKLQRIALKDIIYIEGQRDYTAFHTIQGKYLSADKLRELEQVLPVDFARIHRSYIINTHHIAAIEKWKVMLRDIQLPVGENYRTAFAARTGL
jgi:two-component system, LytTR family, response regulator